MPWAPLLIGCGAGRESAAHNRRADRDVGHRRRPPNNVQSTMPRPHTRALTPVAHIPPRTHGIAEDADHGYDRAHGSPGLPTRVRLPLARDGPDPSGPRRTPGGPWRAAERGKGRPGRPFGGPGVRAAGAPAGPAAGPPKLRVRYVQPRTRPRPWRLCQRGRGVVWGRLKGGAGPPCRLASAGRRSRSPPGRGRSNPRRGYLTRMEVGRPRLGRESAIRFKCPRQLVHARRALDSG